MMKLDNAIKHEFDVGSSEAQATMIQDFILSYPNLKIEAIADKVKNDMIFKIKSYYLKKKIFEKHGEFTVYLNLWEHVKESLFPQWLKKKFPVKKSTMYTSFTLYNVCPHVKIEPLQPHITFLESKLNWLSDESTPINVDPIDKV